MKTSLEDEKVFSFLNDYNKVEVGLTILGLKSALILGWWEPIDKEDLMKKESQEFEQFLMGYRLEVRSIFDIESQHIFCRFLCAGNQHDLERLIATEYVEGDSQDVIKEKDMERGILLGYPKTAVEAYAEGDCIDDEELPESARKSAEFKFLQNRLSRKHWQTELDEFKKKIGILKESFPELYRRIVEGHEIKN